MAVGRGRRAHRAAGVGAEPAERPGQPRRRCPVPALEPAAECSRFHGFLGIGKPLSGSGAPQANSLVTVLPSSTAPALRSRSTTGASQSAPHARSRMWLLAVVGASRVAMMSLTPSGMPCSGPLSMPLARSASAWRAAARAGSPVTAMKAPRSGFRCSIRSSIAGCQIGAGDLRRCAARRRRP